MVVYIDLVFLFNFIINFILMFSIEKVFKDKIKYFRLFIASFIGSCIVVLSLFYKEVFKIFKFSLGILIMAIGTQKITFSKSIIKISMFYTENLALVGFLGTFEVNTCVWLIFATALILGLLFFEHFKKYYIFLLNAKYNVIVTQKNQIFKCGAFLDTGNSASNSYGVPIVFLDKKYQKDIFQEYQLVSINTVNGEKLEKAYKVDKFEIIVKRKKIEKEVLVVFTNLDKECLLNNMLMI